MIRSLCHIVLGVILLSLAGACNRTDVYDEKLKMLDSLSGAVSSALKAYEKGIDTVMLGKCVQRFNYYSDFIHQNISDTISKAEADNLQHFYSGGEGLKRAADNRLMILQRAGLVTAQLSNLAKDITEKSIEPERLQKYSIVEKQEASRLIDALFEQQKQINTGMEEFRNALPGVELLIRTRNNGELPRIIKDSVSL